MKVLYSATLDKLNIVQTKLEGTFTRGLPGFSIVGLASNDVQEARDRVKSALMTNKFTFPPLKITINLAPSGIKKKGTHLDLAIAMLIATKDEDREFDLHIFGELGLGGEVKHTDDIFPIILALKEKDAISKAIVPKASMQYLKMIEGIDFYPATNLQDALDVFAGSVKPVQAEYTIQSKRIHINDKEYFYNETYAYDFNQVKGQTLAKRAALIAAAGMHNLLLEGSPGCGKSMIAKRIPFIMPPLTAKEILTIAKNDFLSGTEPAFEAARPNVSPHCSASKASLFGGGSTNAKLGEVAKAHKGVLFFDELPHFQKSSLESLREPLQDRSIHISRVNSKIKYETDFLFIGAMNPCPCGNLLSTHHECRCSDVEIKRYKNKLSSPLLDRIELQVSMQEVSPDDKSDMSSKQMHQQVLDAFAMQKQRGQDEFNGKLDEKNMQRFCRVEDESVLATAAQRFGLSHRAIGNIQKVARTIADLEKSERIEKKHLLEAMSFRKR